MSTNGAVMAVNEQDTKRQQALLKAVGLDRVPPEQRELAMAIADRYGLDLLLKHLVLVDGRPYITRDGLLHIAHRSGAFDGMEVTDPTIVDIGPEKCWTARCSVYRRDMTRPFTYAGRYPTKGGNQRFAPEMAVKVSEVMALRRAFDVSAPVLEERWDLDTAGVPETATTPPPSLDERIAQRSQRVTTSAAPVAGMATDQRPVRAEADDVPSAAEAAAESAAPSSSGAADDADVIDGQAVEVQVAVDTKPAQCDGFHDEMGRCRQFAGHDGPHKSKDGVWPR